MRSRPSSAARGRSGAPPGERDRRRARGFARGRARTGREPAGCLPWSSSLVRGSTPSGAARLAPPTSPTVTPRARELVRRRADAPGDERLAPRSAPLALVELSRPRPRPIAVRRAPCPDAEASRPPGSRSLARAPAVSAARALVRARGSSCGLEAGSSAASDAGSGRFCGDFDRAQRLPSASLPRPRREELAIDPTDRPESEDAPSAVTVVARGPTSSSAALSSRGRPSAWIGVSTFLHATPAARAPPSSGGGGRRSPAGSGFTRPLPSRLGLQPSRSARGLPAGAPRRQVSRRRRVRARGLAAYCRAPRSGKWRAPAEDASPERRRSPAPDLDRDARLSNASSRSTYAAPPAGPVIERKCSRTCASASSDTKSSPSRAPAAASAARTNICSS